MPEDPKKDNKKVTGLTPSMQEGVNIAKRERNRRDLAEVKPYGFFSKLLSQGNYGYTSPFGSIYLNQDKVGGLSPEEIADLVTHEQTHVDQQRRRGKGGLWELLNIAFGGERLPYHERPDEMEAFQNERQRRGRMNRPQAAYPGFSGKTIVPNDVNLPLSGLKK